LPIVQNPRNLTNNEWTSDYEIGWLMVVYMSAIVFWQLNGIYLWLTWLLCSFLIAYILFMLNLYKKMQNWKCVIAEIKQLRIAKKLYSSQSFSHVYSLEIIFNYSVLGKEYQSDKLTWKQRDFQTQDITLIESRAKKLRRRTKINAYYNPRNPTDAVIYKDHNGKSSIIYIFLGIFTLGLLVASLFKF